MNLSDPAADLIGRNTARILTRLSLIRDGLTGRRVAELAGVPATTANRTLAELEEIGLVSADPVGRAKLYRLNRSHVLWPPVRQMLEASERIERAIAEISSESVGDRASIALYGSVARGEAGRASDVDVLVVWHGDVPLDRREQLLHALDERIALATGNRVELVDIEQATLEQMGRSGDPLAHSWQHEAKTLWGRDITAMLNEARA